MITGRHVGDIHTMLREINYVHLQSGCASFVDMWVAVPLQPFAVAKTNRQTLIGRQTDR